jgi:hypothetical protein
VAAFPPSKVAAWAMRRSSIEDWKSASGIVGVVNTAALAVILVKTSSASVTNTSGFMPCSLKAICVIILFVSYVLKMVVVSLIKK